MKSNSRIENRESEERRASITPLRFKSSAALRCAELYHEWKSPIPFWKDYLDYTVTGFVCVRPSCFWMAKIINLSDAGEKPDLCWFVRAAVGDLREMMFETLPCYLPKISFCRFPKSERQRVYPMERFLKLVNRNVRIENRKSEPNYGSRITNREGERD